ncbi:helix-turn-helix domain-containing protein [Lacinutrix jangbogonensis]|uniref:helix-turn-helix domain-containing protein n=1 Tax=Lacinutrix jangbogonensis TaxID=1469557 RepID=UPI00053DBDA8|nr:AraC family transcriptional regulator [Lacinutrix jangbogonensis]
MLENIFNIILLTGAVHGFLFNSITLMYHPKKKISKAILFLNLLVLSISLNNIQAWLISNDYSSSWFFIKNLEVPWYVFIVPAFYSFLIHFLLVEKKYKNYIKLIIYLFFIEIILRLILISLCYNTKIEINIITSYTRIEEAVNALFSFYIFYRCYKIIFKEQFNYKYALSFNDNKWLKQFIILGSLVLLFWLLAILSNIFIDIPQFNMYSLLRIGSSLVLYWIGYQGFIRYNVMTDRIRLRKDILEKKNTKPPKIKNKIVDSQSRFFNEICEHIENNALFLNENLCLEDLSIELNISASHLSKVINTHKNLNFTNLINEYRVNYAKSLLINSTYSNYTITAIGLESGFNSKSTFYSAFKKFTNKTPSQYRSNNTM